MHNDCFLDILTESWEQPCSGMNMYKMYVKLKRLKPSLKMLNKK